MTTSQNQVKKNRDVLLERIAECKKFLTSMEADLRLSTPSTAYRLDTRRFFQVHVADIVEASENYREMIVISQLSKD